MADQYFIVAPHYPPSSLPPAQRVRMMVNHMREFGIEPVVFTTDSKYREERIDPGILKLTQSDVEVFYSKSIPYKFSRKVGVGDLGLRLLPYLFFDLRKAMIKKRPKCVIYLVPPWYLLLMAPILKLLTGIPFAIDFIDPWVKQKSKEVGLKEQFSQTIARFFEGWVVKRAAFIYSVSQAINDDILIRTPKAEAIFKAIPYGVELNDFNGLEFIHNNTAIINFKYIGAVWPLSKPVLDAMFNAFRRIHAEHELLKINFIGTSYAGEGLSKPQLTDLIRKYELDGVVHEQENRIPYTTALNEYMSADALFLFGDTGIQYAASKLMTIIASGKPFFAFLHRESYPYKLLEELNYSYLVGYSSEIGDLPEDNFIDLVKVILNMVANLERYISLNMDNSLLKSKTASGMTEEIVSGIQSALKRYD